MLAHSVRGTSILGCPYAFQYPLEVTLEVHCPLIEVASGQGGQPAPHGSLDLYCSTAAVP
jgi:hypothetical protein